MDEFWPIKTDDIFQLSVDMNAVKFIVDKRLKNHLRNYNQY